MIIFNVIINYCNNNNHHCYYYCYYYYHYLVEWQMCLLTLLPETQEYLRWIGEAEKVNDWRIRSPRRRRNGRWIHICSRVVHATLVDWIQWFVQVCSEFHISFFYMLPSSCIALKLGIHSIVIFNFQHSTNLIYI